jgi:hypothetical protein
MPLNRGRWRPVAARVASARTATGEAPLRVVTVTAAGDVPEWGARATENHFVVSLDRNRQAVRGLGVALYGQHGHTSAWPNPPTFPVDMPADGQLVMEVEEIGGEEVLEASIDGESAAKVTLAGGRRALRDDERFVAVAVPKGSHRITVDNVGPSGDWIRVRRYHFVVPGDDPARLVDASGLSGRKQAFLYLENQSYDRVAQTLGQQAAELLDVVVEVNGFPDGQYRATFFDTAKGTTTGAADVVCRGGDLAFRVPHLLADLAVKLKGE